MHRWMPWMLVLAACGGAESSPLSTEARPDERATGQSAPSVAPPCGPGTDPHGPLIAFGVYGTHGQDFSETLSVTCDGEVVLDAPRPWTTELAERPGRYTHHLDPSFVATLQGVAVRLAAPVGTPSLPPQGVDVTVSTGTVPPISRDLRPGENPADGEAAAMMSAIVGEIVARLPPLVRCPLTVALSESPMGPPRAGQPGLVLLTITNPTERPLEVELGDATRTFTATTPAGSVLVPEIMSVMLGDATVLAFLELESDRPTTLTLAPRAAPFTALHVTMPAAGPTTLTATMRARVSGCEGGNGSSEQTFEATLPLVVAPAE